VVTGTTSTQTLSFAHSSKETLEQDADLGTLQVSGVPAKGRRQTFQDASGQRTHTLETWFSPTLGLTVHMESRNLRGDSVVSDLSELRLGEPVASSAAAVPVTGPAVPLLVLYRGLFTHIAHMERDRLADDPNRRVNMAEIEDHLRTKLDLSATDWQVLVDKSVKVEGYTREMSKQAHSFAEQDRAARRENPLSANTLAAGRAKLHTMQLDLNTHIQGDIDQFNKAVGPEAKERIEAYLQGPMAASTSVLSIRAAQSVQKEQVR